jgi:hypothetical protein
MTPREKAKELVDKFIPYAYDGASSSEENAQECALIAVENEYHSLREQIFNLRSVGVIESEMVYLFRIDALLREEQEVKQEIEAL